MDRRQYLGAAAAGVAVGVVGVGGYTLLSEDTGGPPPVATSAYPPYPNANTYDLSGDGATSSEPFRIQNEGPTIVTADHSDKAEGSTPFYMRLESTTTDTIRKVVRLTGPYIGTTVVRPVPKGEYILVVSGTPERNPLPWDAKVYDIPSYNDTGLSLPFEYAGGLNKVIGPINFGDLSLFSFSFSINDDTESKLHLIDREGNFERRILRAPFADNYSGTFPAGGIGYISIDTNTTWKFSMKQSEKEVPKDLTANKSDSKNNITQTNSSSSNNQSN